MLKQDRTPLTLGAVFCWPGPTRSSRDRQSIFRPTVNRIAGSQSPGTVSPQIVEGSKVTVQYVILAPGLAPLDYGIVSEFIQGRHEVLPAVEQEVGGMKLGEEKKVELAPGEAFKYSSWCPLKTPTGMMHGTYQMVRANGNHFDIEIAPFALKARYTIH